LKILTDSIEKELSALGESSKQPIYFCFEKKYNLPKKKMADNTDLLVYTSAPIRHMIDPVVPL